MPSHDAVRLVDELSQCAEESTGISGPSNVRNLIVQGNVIQFPASRTKRLD